MSNKERVTELKCRAFDLLIVKQNIEQELQQINITLYQLGRAQTATTTENVGQPAAPVESGDTGQAN